MLPNAVPFGNPTDLLQKLVQVEGDHFGGVRNDYDGAGETWLFERNESGEIVAAQRHSPGMIRAE